MNSIEEIQQAIRQLPRFQREDLAEWILSSEDFGDRVAETAPAYAEPGERRLLTVEEYLQLDVENSVRYEYIAGEIFAMTGPTLRHEVIVVNLVATLHAHLRGGPCKVFPSNATLRLRVNQDDIFYHPDVMVACGQLTEEDLSRQYLTHPCLVVEVLSPSTETIDRREKALNYRHVQSLEEYVLIAQRSRQVTIYRRSDDWVPLVLASDAEVEFRSIGLNVTLEAISEGTQ